jgi:hypothetical protein
MRRTAYSLAGASLAKGTLPARASSASDPGKCPRDDRALEARYALPAGGDGWSRGGVMISFHPESSK